MAGIDAAKSVLVCIDWQIKLHPAMPKGIRQTGLTKAETLTWLASEMDVPVIATEQYPKGLGPTVPSLRREAIEKITFSAYRTPAFVEALAATGRKQVVLIGMETHICVAQTAADLLANGYEVWVVADAVLSRAKLDWQMGIDRMRGDGARITTTEAVCFEWLGEAGSALFKQVSRRIK